MKHLLFLLLLSCNNPTHICTLEDCRYMNTNITNSKQMIQAFKRGEEITDTNTLKFWDLHFKQPFASYESLEEQVLNSIK